MNNAGTLSNVDIERELQAEPPLIQNVPPDEELPTENFQPAAYDLRVGHIITAREYIHYEGAEGRDIRGRRKDTLLLKPGESATLATLERVHMPRGNSRRGINGINGIIVARDSFAKKGLLTLNAGHIDPGHNGFVTAQVINLTDRPFPLHLDVSYFSIVFSYLNSEGKKRPPLKSDEERLLEYRFAAAQAPVSLVQKETLEKVFVSYNDLSFALLRRVGPFVVGLAVLAGVGVAIFVD